MKLLDSIEVTSKSGPHRIELFQGDLTQIPSEHAVDILVISAFPNNYTPTPNSLIGALSRIGVNVRDLARDKEVDLRMSFSCWMSKEIEATSPNIKFRRILVFEPLVRGKPSEVVGDIFQSLMPFVYVKPYVKSIAMPLVATGNQGIRPERILEPLISAAINWFSLGLPVKVIKIVEHSEQKAIELKGAFSVLKQRYAPHSPNKNSTRDFRYDFFISYSHQDYDHVEFLYNELKLAKSSLRIFMDRRNLQVGSAWQQELYEAIDDCAQVIVVYSPTYLSSKICKEEYNIALLRHREEGNVLVPLYLKSAQLPTYMRLIQFIDCREADHHKLREACRLIL